MDAINWHSFFFLFFALTASCFAVAVVASGNIVRMACYLVVSLSAVAGLFFLAGADFVGAMQLMIYVGGTLVLLIFGVMLTGKGPGDELPTGGGQWILAIAAGGCLLAILLQTAFSVSGWSREQPAHQAATVAQETVAQETVAQETVAQETVAQETVAQETVATTIDAPGETATPLGMGLLGIRTDSLQEQNKDIREGMSGYLLPFEIVSVHLLVVLIGAAYLARSKKREEKTEDRL